MNWIGNKKKKSNWLCYARSIYLFIPPTLRYSDRYMMWNDILLLNLCQKKFLQISLMISVSLSLIKKLLMTSDFLLCVWLTLAGGLACLFLHTTLDCSGIHSSRNYYYQKHYYQQYYYDSTSSQLLYQQQYYIGFLRSAGSNSPEPESSYYIQ